MSYIAVANQSQSRGYQCFRLDRTDRSKHHREHINACLIDTRMEDSEYRVMEIKADDVDIQLVNFYCPNDKPPSLDTISTEVYNFIIVGDFNSHSQSWGYRHMDRRGEDVENWQDDNRLLLINSPSNQPTFYSRQWHTTSTPDIAFCTEDLHGSIRREVGEQLGGSDHRPVFLKLNIGASTEATFPRWKLQEGQLDSYLNTEPALSPRTSPSKAETSTWSQRTSTRPYLRLPRKPYQEEQEETTDHTGVENYKTSRMHCQKPEQQPKPILHRRTPPKLQQAKAKFLRHKDTRMLKRLERKNSFPRLWERWLKALETNKAAQWWWKLKSKDHPGREQQVTDWETSCWQVCWKLCKWEQDSHQRFKAERSKERDQGKNSQQNSCETHALAPQTWWTTKSCEETETEEVARTRWHNQWDGYPPRQCSSVQTPADLQPQLGTRGASTDMARSNHYPHSEEREGPKKANSYQPVSLTSCVVKTMERIVNECLKWYLETQNLLAPEQAGFWSTEDQGTYLSQEIEDAFQEQKLVLVSWIDLKKAFDKVWMEGLLVKLLRNGIASNMFSLVKYYLYNRRARVSVDRIHSKKILPRHGVPQGGVLSPTLFLLLINDLVSELPKGVKAALYADDLVIWCKEEYATTATYRMQLAADKLNSWTEKWCVAVNKDKSSTTLFTLSPKQKACTITLGGTPLKEEDEATYLGVTFDKMQTWKQHIAKAEGKARRKMAILRKLAGTTWGASEKVLETVNQGTVGPHLEYSSTAWSTTAKTNQQALDKVKNQALRLITGSMRSTPITEIRGWQESNLLVNGGMPRTWCRQKSSSAWQTIPWKPGWKISPRIGWKEAVLSMRARSWAASFTTDCPRAHFLLPTRHARALGIGHNWHQGPYHSPFPLWDAQDDTLKQSLTLAVIAERCPQEAWIHVFTDGSATNAVTSGGAGILVHFPGQKVSASVAVGRHCS